MAKIKYSYEDAKIILDQYGLTMKEENFISFSTKIEILCKCKVNHIYNTLSCIKYGNGVKCKDCRDKEASLRFKKNFNEVIQFIKDNSQCILLSTAADYKNNRSKLKLVCSCGDYFTRDYHTIKESVKDGKNVLCKKCAYGHVKRQELDKIALDNSCTVLDVELSDNRILAKNKITIQCECSNIFTTKVSHFTHHGTTRCKTCTGKTSKAELKIASILDNNNIHYKKEYTFDDLKGSVKLLPFDFAIFDSNNILKGIIEFDGKQHFEAIEMFGGEHGLKILQTNDRKKDQYCLNNNIKLKRISYKDEKNLENIVLSFTHEIL